MQTKRPRPFKSTAPYYLRFRPPYPQGLFDHLKARFSLDGTGRLLDLGCGPGKLALSLAPLFERVVGVDPEPEMLGAAAAQARRLGVTNVTWVEGSSEGLGPQLGAFRLVTMGFSFHWMDRDRTLAALHSLIDPGGGITVVDEDLLDTPENTWWRDGVVDVLRRWIGENPWQGLRVSKSAERHDTVIARSPFGRMETWTLRCRRNWDLESVIGVLYSHSWASVEVLGDLRERVEAEMRRALLQMNPEGQYVEDVVLRAILAWKD